ncbi:MAG: hypothetical protein CMH81_05270 [Nitrospiraceae bacterium]|jgi:hypothetical protein|nr:hypothetical protein [Nitrospiraceae bacterium]
MRIDSAGLVRDKTLPNLHREASCSSLMLDFRILCFVYGVQYDGNAEEKMRDNDSGEKFVSGLRDGPC